MTVCAKSLTLPGDAVPCPLGPEDTREPSMTSKPESKASEQLQWDSFALWPAIRYVFKPMDKNYSQHGLKPPLVEMQFHLALCAGHAPEKLRAKWKCEYVIFYYWLLSFQRHATSGKMFASKTHHILKLCFSLNDGYRFYLWGLKWTLKSSSLKGSHDFFVTAPEAIDDGPYTLLEFLLICWYQSLTFLMINLEVRVIWSMEHFTYVRDCKNTMKSKTTIRTNRGH